MKKMIKLSIASAVAIASLTTSASAMDVDLKGDAILYYQTTDSGAGNLFDQDNSAANVGLRVKVAVDAGNGYTFGMNAIGLDTAGLESNVVSTTIQGESGITEAFIGKTFGDTTVKLGRQELSTPLLFSESKLANTSFNAGLLVNKSLPNTTVVGAYVGGANGHADLGEFNTIDTVYALGFLNESIAGTPVNVWLYNQENKFDGVWADVKTNVNGVELAVHGASIDSDAGVDSDMLGIKGSTKVQDIKLSLMYDSVNAGDIDIANQAGTKTKLYTPKTKLYTQMVANQNYISGANGDADTFGASVEVPVGNGTLIARAAKTDIAAGDYTETNFIYKTKVFGTELLTAYVNTDDDVTGIDSDIVRVVAKYSF